MPIYAYKCASCGQSKDVLQKISDAPLTVCPFCGEPAFTKQVTAAGFQLKGSGWYVTDFRGGSTAASAPGGAASGGESAPSSATAPAKPDARSETQTDTKAAAAPAPAPAAPSTSTPGKSGSGS
ncbi:MAG: zinc ribbon domain-containing protein [Comamonadaceae bacterium]|nr:MAG: zinc ribbon domain-containing protein [Comamonadaceae bacterium]